MLTRCFKYIVIVLGLYTAVNNIASAQCIMQVNDAPKYVDKVVCFLAMAYTVKYDAVTATCLLTFPYPGTVDNSPIITVVLHDVHSAKRIRWLKSLPGKWLNLTGRLLLNNGKFTINGNDPHTKVSQFFGMIEVPEVPPVPEHPVPASSDTTQHK